MVCWLSFKSKSHLRFSMKATSNTDLTRDGSPIKNETWMKLSTSPKELYTTGQPVGHSPAPTVNIAFVTTNVSDIVKYNFVILPVAYFLNAFTNKEYRCFFILLKRQAFNRRTLFLFKQIFACVECQVLILNISFNFCQYVFNVWQTTDVYKITITVINELHSYYFTY